MFLTDIFPRQNNNYTQVNPNENYDFIQHTNNLQSNLHKSIKLEDNTEKLENILELKLKEYLSHNENLYDKTRSDLINLISEMKSSSNNSKNNENQIILDELMQLKNIVRSNYTSFPVPFIQPQAISNAVTHTKPKKVSEPVILDALPKEEVIKKESKGSYYKVIPSVWESVKQEFTCLDDKWKDLCYSRGDGIYIKIKKKYEKLDKNNISKIISKLQN